MSLRRLAPSSSEKKSIDTYACLVQRNEPLLSFVCVAGFSDFVKALATFDVSEETRTELF